MRWLGSALALALLVALVGSTSAGAHGFVAARYDAMGPVGILTITHADGQFFEARNSQGQLAAIGVAVGDIFRTPALNSGPGPGGVLMTVTVGGATLSLDAAEWEWAPIQ
jgi:hypothetical protein